MVKETDLVVNANPIPMFAPLPPHKHPRNKTENTLHHFFHFSVFNCTSKWHTTVQFVEISNTIEKQK